MKPRFRPGKAITGGRSAREALATAKPLTENQIEHLRQEKPAGSFAPKAGRGGRKAHWNIDYEEGIRYAEKPMPYREEENLSQNGIRRIPKRGS